MKNLRTLFEIALVVLALNGPAASQIYPDIPSGTVIGRIDAGVGSPETITFNQLGATLVQYIPNTCTGAYCASSQGQLPGTTTNDNASAGNIGEVIASIGISGNGTPGFTNGSAVITDAGTCATGATTGCVGIGSVLNFTTTGSLPTNFATSTAYYVSATGFVAGTSYEVATTPTGTPIVAGSAGSGTQTRVSNVALTNTTARTVASVLLTPGQWSCNSTVEHIFTSATTTILAQFISTTNNSSSGAIAESDVFIYEPLTTTSYPAIFSGAPIILKLASSTQYYLEAQDTFSAGTDAGSGSLVCTRQR